MEKIIIAGLGNPGKKYKNSPHNAGFAVIDKAIENLKEAGEDMQETHKKDLFVCEATNEAVHLLLVKPLTFMNRSGGPVKSVVDYCNLKNISNLWVIHDDIDLPIGKMRVSHGSSSGGQKGVEDIIQKLGTKDFYRFRIGVRTKEIEKERDPELVSKYVTKKLRGKRKKELQKIVDFTAETLIRCIENQKVETGDFAVDS